LQALDEAKVPSGRVYTAKDIAEDPHFRARDMILTTTLPDGTALEVPGVVPKLSLTPGTLRTPAPALGEHTEAVLRQAGISETALAELRAKGVI
jgi:formyl-CoA transferase